MSAQADSEGVIDTLQPDLIQDLRRLNPWWEGKPARILPETRRHLVSQIERRLNLELAPIVVVRGPRQIGKTTAHHQLIDSLLRNGRDRTRILHVQFDELESLSDLREPILRIVEWYEASILKRTLNEAAREGQPALLFLDEVQNLENWAQQMKFLVDSSTVRALVTGSSALRIEQGRDSLAGRITTIEAGVLSLTEIGSLRRLGTVSPFLEDNGLEPLTQKAFWLDLRAHGNRVREFRDVAFQAFSDRGGYPVAHNNLKAEWHAVADQLNETVIKRVIQHDLRIGQRGRKRDAALLEELFRLSCRYTGQTPSIPTLAAEIRQSLHGDIGSQRIRAYLSFLAETLLIRLIRPLEMRLKKRKGSEKICLADHGLRASWLQEVIPLTPNLLIDNPDLSTTAGRIAESCVGAALSTISGLDIAHYPEQGTDPEVDFVLVIGTRRIPIEVKYSRSIKFEDTVGLRSFMEKSANNAPFGILVTLDDDARVDDPRIVSLPLSSFLLLR